MGRAGYKIQNSSPAILMLLVYPAWSLRSTHTTRKRQFIQLHKNIHNMTYLRFSAFRGFSLHLIALLHCSTHPYGWRYGVCSAHPPSWLPRVLFSQTSSSSFCIIMFHGSLRLWSDQITILQTQSVAQRANNWASGALWEQHQAIWPGPPQPKPTITIYTDRATPQPGNTKWELASARVR